MIYTKINDYILKRGFPNRILSLCPSFTRTIEDLNGLNFLVGLTDYCILKTKENKEIIAVGGPKTIDIKKIESLKPEIILASKEENTKMQIEALSLKFDIVLYDINSYDEGLSMIHDFGILLQCMNKAHDMIEKIESQYEAMKAPSKSLSCLYLIWKKPWMACGTDTFIDSMLEKHGLENIIKEKRYPIINNLEELYADVLLLPNEPYHFNESHRNFFNNMKHFKSVLCIDGTLFSWYGSNMLDSRFEIREMIKNIEIP